MPSQLFSSLWNSLLANINYQLLLRGFFTLILNAFCKQLFFMRSW